MKCQYCEGLIILERGIGGQPDRLKCVNCGRDPNKVEAIHESPLQKGDGEMEEQMKICNKCKRELPATNEYFAKNKSFKDGLEFWCKDCKNKKQKDYRVKRAEEKGRQSVSPCLRTGAAGKRSPKKRLPPLERKTNHTPITIATPEEIIKALRKGIAQEIIQTIQEKFA